MIKSIIPLPNTREWCEHCKKRCDDIRSAYLLTSTEIKKTIILCNCCMDLALNEFNILPEEF